MKKSTQHRTVQLIHDGYYLITSGMQVVQKEAHNTLTLKEI